MYGWIVAGLGLGLAGGVMNGQMDLRLAVRTDRSVYAAGDSMVVTLTLTNPGTDTATVRFSSGQRFDVEIRDSGGAVVWRWGEGRMFVQMLGQVRVPPGDTVEYQAPVAAPSTPGRYTVMGRITARDGALEQRVQVEVRT